MRAVTFLELLRSGHLPLLLDAVRLAGPSYRVSFLASAASSGLLSALAEGPKSADEIAEALGCTSREGRRIIRAWLEVGVRLKVLRMSGDRHFGLGCSLARRLACEKHDSVAAAIIEMAKYHQEAILEAPRLACEGKRLKLTSQDGRVIARSTLVLEPFVREAVDMAIRSHQIEQVLEIGCGSGAYARHLAARLPTATIRGLELQEDVAALARENVSKWGLGDRVVVENTDVRGFTSNEKYDLVTLLNNIYYFREQERPLLLESVRRMLKPGGRLLLTTSCRGGSVGLDVLHLWFSASELDGGLPELEEMKTQIAVAGFRSITTHNLIPGEQYYAFIASE